MSESKSVAQAEVKQHLGELVPQAADIDIDSPKRRNGCRRWTTCSRAKVPIESDF